MEAIREGGDSPGAGSLHKAKKTDRIKQLLGECHTTPVFVPAGCTSIVQPLDVSFNAPFKKKVECAALQHVQENLDGYLNGRFTAGERRILMTKWVGVAWEDLAKTRRWSLEASKNVESLLLLMVRKIQKSTWRVWRITR